MIRFPLLALLSCLFLLGSCSSVPKLTSDSDPWEFSPSAHKAGLEFISAADFDSDSPKVTVVGVRVADGKDVKMKDVNFQLLAGDLRQKVHGRAGGNAKDSAYILFGGWTIKTETRPLFIRGRVTLEDGEVVEETWLLR